MGVYRKQGAWWIDWYEGRRRLRKKTRSATKTEAKKLLEKVRARTLPRDLGFFDPKLKSAELVTRYLGAIKGTKAHHTWRRAYGALRNFFSWCPVTRVSKLTPELFQRYAAKRKDDGASVRTINIELTNLKTCLNWGVRNRLLPANPMANAEKLRGASKGRLRFLSEEEIRRLLQAARGTVYHDIFYTLVRTGMRKGELIHLRWDDVDFDWRVQHACRSGQLPSSRRSGRRRAVENGRCHGVAGREEFDPFAARRAMTVAELRPCSRNAVFSGAQQIGRVSDADYQNDTLLNGPERSILGLPPGADPSVFRQGGRQRCCTPQSVPRKDVRKPGLGATAS